MALMETGKSEKVRGRIAGGNGPLGGTADCRGVVVENSEGTGTGIKGLGKDVLVGHHTSQLEIADGEIARRVVIRNESLLDVKRKGGTPKEGRSTINEPDATHARFGGINGANAGGVIWNNFRELGRTKVQIGGEGFKIIQLGAHMGINTHAVSIGMKDAGLKGAEKATTTGNIQDHTAEFAQNFLPSREGNAFAAAKVIKNRTQTVVTVWGQLQGLLGGIDKPTEENFGCAPATVALEKFLDGDGLLMEFVGRIKRANDFIDSMEQDAARDTATTGITLN
jgi:hypothetical protein